MGLCSCFVCDSTEYNRDFCPFFFQFVIPCTYLQFMLLAPGHHVVQVVQTGPHVSIPLGRPGDAPVPKRYSHRVQTQGLHPHEVVFYEMPSSVRFEDVFGVAPLPHQLAESPLFVARGVLFLEERLRRPPLQQQPPTQVHAQPLHKGGSLDMRIDAKEGRLKKRRRGKSSTAVRIHRKCEID